MIHRKSVTLVTLLQEFLRRAASGISKKIGSDAKKGKQSLRGGGFYKGGFIRF